MELPFDEAAEVRWQESRPAEADNMDVGPVTEANLQRDLMEAGGKSASIPPQRPFATLLVASVNNKSHLQFPYCMLVRRLACQAQALPRLLPSGE